MQALVPDLTVAVLRKGEDPVASLGLRRRGTPVPLFALTSSATTRLNHTVPMAKYWACGKHASSMWCRKGALLIVKSIHFSADPATRVSSKGTYKRCPVHWENSSKFLAMMEKDLLFV